MKNANDKLTFTIRVETKDKEEAFKLLELTAYLSQKDQNLFQVKIVSKVDILDFFKDNFTSSIITTLSKSREITLDLKVPLIEIDLELEKIFSKEFGNKYNIWVYSNEKWSNADGLSQEIDSEEDDEEEYEGLGSIEMGDPFETISEEESVDSFVKVQVLYATDRLKTTDTRPNHVFGPDRSQTGIDMGVCEVSIPKGHEMGKIERPSWWRELILEKPENPEKHISILNLQSKTVKEFSLLFNNKVPK